MIVEDRKLSQPGSIPTPPGTHRVSRQQHLASHVLEQVADHIADFATTICKDAELRAHPFLLIKKIELWSNMISHQTLLDTV